MLARNPENIDLILEESRQEVNLEDIEGSIAQLDKAATPVRPEALVGAFEETLDRAGEYVKGGDHKNALAILGTITGPIVCHVAKMDLAEEHDKSTIDSFFSSIEEAWSTCIAAVPVGETPEERQKDKELAEGWFKQLAGWRTQVTEKMGPMFSDPLRALKKRIQKHNKDTPASSSTAAPATKKAKH